MLCARRESDLFPLRGRCARFALQAARLLSPAAPSIGVRLQHCEEVRVRTATASAGEHASPAKPTGGYQLIPVMRLATAWWAYREKLIRLVDLRVWFAAWEMRARRCRRPAPLPRRYGLGELQGLTGLSLKRLKASLRRLEGAGLLAWSESAIAFPVSVERVPLSDRDGFRAFLGHIPNRRRMVPVPRRILRLLAGGCRPALIATILGHLFRCLYVKGGQCQPVGRVKASWIADTFDVGLRRVKEARQELVAMGWLILLDSTQWALNRWGALIRINLGWSRLDGLMPAADDAAGAYEEEVGGEPTPPMPGLQLAPPALDSGPESAPPDSSDENPFQGDKNQEPAAAGTAGFFIDHREEGRACGAASLAQTSTATLPAQAAPSARPAPTVAGRPGRPDLRHVVPEDLKDTGRLLDLYEQAVDLGLVRDSEHDRLRFMAAAEHARVIGTKNPCGLFARLVRGGLLHFVTYDDEVAASVRLRRHLYGAAPESMPPPRMGGVISRPELSDDAKLVQAVRAAAAKAGYRGDAFPLLKRQKPEWARERWDKAVAELDG
jgi:hypothetical protein